MMGNAALSADLSEIGQFKIWGGLHGGSAVTVAWCNGKGLIL
jgi:hypothetical protein